MSEPIKNVVVAGPNGTLGDPVIQQLRGAGFNLTLITRDTEKTQAKFKDLQVVYGDYTSVEALTSALRKAAPDAQALVCLLNRDEVESQITLTNAAIAAGITHIIPSCFGGGTRDAFMRSLPIWASKTRMEDDIREKGDRAKCTWTGIQTGVFLDWALQNGAFLLNTKGEEGLMGGVTMVFDGGDIPVSATCLDDIGRAVANALLNKDQVLNRDVFVHSAVVTQNQLLRYAKAAAPDRAFKEIHLDTAEMERTAWEKWNAGDKSKETMRGFMPRAVFGKRLGMFNKTDNALLGIEQWDDAKLKEFVTRYVV